MSIEELEILRKKARNVVLIGILTSLIAAIILLIIPPKYGINCATIARQPSNIAFGCPIIV